MPLPTDYIERLEKWFDRHGSSMFEDANEWINNMSNFELLEWIQIINNDLNEEARIKP